MAHSSVNPTDVIQVQVLIGEVMDHLTAMRRGQRLLLRTWSTTSVGLSTLVRASYLASQAMAECYQLLLSMEETDGAHGPETQTKDSSPYTTSARTSTSSVVDCSCGDSCDRLTARLGRGHSSDTDQEVMAGPRTAKK